MTLSGFIATIWSARLLANLQKSLIFGQLGVINRDYEGEIKGKGSTVKILSIGDLTIGDYTRDTDISDPEALTDSGTTLYCDQAKYFNFAVDDVDAAQMSPKLLDGAMQQAAYNLADVADQYISAAMFADADVGNQLGTATLPIIPVPAAMATQAYAYLLQLKTKLSLANVPVEGRWAIVPPWFMEQLVADERFAMQFIGQSNIAPLVTGVVGKAAGLTVFESNNCPTVAGAGAHAGEALDVVVAGHPMACTFADSINKVEPYRPDKRFSDAMKGLHVYGAKVTRSSALACMICQAA